METDPQAYHQPLLTWFSRQAAPLPWRVQRTPYTAWLAEIMLQQTQVNTVIPYYERFLAHFPSVQALAAAPLADVLKLWEGLGYYSRARRLHRAARLIVEEWGGQFPTTAAGWRSLPGIGPYTAGAIASIAQGVDAPAVDGNISRVLARLFNITAEIDRPETRQQVWALAADLLLPGQAGPWNEALMDLGRTICIPKKPACDQCPLGHLCQARQAGVQAQRPVKAARAALPHQRQVAAVLLNPGRQALLLQRPPHGLLGGLWEFPSIDISPEEDAAQAAQARLLPLLGIPAELGAHIAEVKHAFTHFKLTRTAFLCRSEGGTPRLSGHIAFAWAALDALDAFALPRTEHKILAALGQHTQLSLGL